MPISPAGTAFCTTSTTTCMIRPSPAPNTNRNAQISQIGVSADSVVIDTIAMPVRIVPTIG